MLVQVQDIKINKQNCKPAKQLQLPYRTQSCGQYCCIYEFKIEKIAADFHYKLAPQNKDQLLYKIKSKDKKIDGLFWRRKCA